MEKHFVRLSPPALFNQEGPHIAATRGYEEVLMRLLEAEAPVDALDFHKHTALFTAAAKGHEGCCAELIKWGANPNNRDRHGTTILEVVAGAGHLGIVKRLVNAGAEVNPILVCCASSPLQAAIENAIELAEGRCEFLADLLRQKERQGSRGLYQHTSDFHFQPKTTRL